MTAREWRIDLEITAPLSLNDRMHWQVKRKAVARVRRQAADATSAAGVPAMPRIAVELHYAPRDARVRDPLNLVATLKAVEDGIVDAGVVPGDDPRYVEPTMPRIDPPTRGTGRLYALIRELPELAR